jgi:polyisoprenoid-binding protein YceI
MKKLVFAVLGVGLIFSSCSEADKSEASVKDADKKPTACECAKANQTGGSKMLELCKELRADSTFDEEYRRCVAAEITGKDPSKVKLVDSDKIKLTFPNDGQYLILPDESKITWTGNKLSAKHTGTVKIQSGSITITDSEIVSGTVAIDMTSITNNDLESDKAAKLEKHLKSEDFFDVTKFSSASFTFKEAKFIHNKAVVEGDLTIKGKTNPVQINLMYSAQGDEAMMMTGAFIFDRSKFDVRFGSESFFDNLGDNLIKDHIMMKFDVKAAK